MSEYNFYVSLTPEETLNILKEHQNADLVYEEINQIDDDHSFGTLIFEKFFMRVSNRVALVVMVNNVAGQTKISVVATGSSQGMIFNFDWGAADDFANSTKVILENYII